MGVRRTVVAIPDEVHELCRFIGTRPEKVRVTDLTCYVWWAGFELRFKLDIDNTWCFDEVVGTGFIHIEQMDSTYYWIGLSSDRHNVAERICVNIGAKRAHVRMTGWVE